MAKLGDLARLIRSKNAGAFMLTFDVMFDDDATYQRVLKSGVLTKERFAKIYKVPEEDVLFFEHEGTRAVREGRYKLTALRGDSWKLYDMERDRYHCPAGKLLTTTGRLVNGGATLLYRRAPMIAERAL